MFAFAEEEKLLIPEKYFSEVKGWSVMQVGQPEVNLRKCLKCSSFEILHRFHLMILNTGKFVVITLKI